MSESAVSTVSAGPLSPDSTALSPVSANVLSASVLAESSGALPAGAEHAMNTESATSVAICFVVMARSPG